MHLLSDKMKVQLEAFKNPLNILQTQIEGAWK